MWQERFFSQRSQSTRIGAPFIFSRLRDVSRQLRSSKLPWHRRHASVGRRKKKGKTIQQKMRVTCACCILCSTTRREEKERERRVFWSEKEEEEEAQEPKQSIKWVEGSPWKRRKNKKKKKEIVLDYVAEEMCVAVEGSFKIKLTRLSSNDLQFRVTLQEKPSLILLLLLLLLESGKERKNLTQTKREAPSSVCVNV